MSFEVKDPIALIECYCFQSNFYANYDIIKNRRIEHVNGIGARLSERLLFQCEQITEATKDMSLFKYDLESFLKQRDESINNQVKELNSKVIEKLITINGIKLSTATKVLHTLYPDIIPMIDNLLQEEYRKEIDISWTDNHSNQIIFDYYKNLKEDDNWKHLTQIYKVISENNLDLTKLRIFDILWWSYLKSKRLRRSRSINWSTIK